MAGAGPSSAGGAAAALRSDTRVDLEVAPEGWVLVEGKPQLTVTVKV